MIRPTEGNVYDDGDRDERDKAELIPTPRMLSIGCLVVVLLMLIMIACANGAPRLKDRPDLNKRDEDWIAKLCDWPAASRPWVVLEELEKGGIDRTHWIELGRRMDKAMRLRFKRIGLEPWDSVFTDPMEANGLVKGHLSGTLCHFKWIEARNGNPDPFQPPLHFWNTGIPEE